MAGLALSPASAPVLNAIPCTRPGWKGEARKSSKRREVHGTRCVITHRGIVDRDLFHLRIEIVALPVDEMQPESADGLPANSALAKSLIGVETSRIREERSAGSRIQKENSH